MIKRGVRTIAAVASEPGRGAARGAGSRWGESRPGGSRWGGSRWGGSRPGRARWAGAAWPALRVAIQIAADAAAASHRGGAALLIGALLRVLDLLHDRLAARPASARRLTARPAPARRPAVRPMARDSVKIFRRGV